MFARSRVHIFGMSSRRYLDAHHVQHWAEAGETNLENLLVLCTAQHTLMYEGGFSIRRHREGRSHFVRPDGRVVEVGSSSAEDFIQLSDGAAEYSVRSTGVMAND